jgi:hypothetical protein
MAGARAVLFLAGCGMLLFIALAIGIGLAIYLVYRRRIMGALGPPAQAVSILEDWAHGEGCELLKVDWSDDRRDQPFADRFGAGWGKRPAIVLVIKVRTPEGAVRRGWAYLQFRSVRSRVLLPETLEVAWDE